MSRNSSTSLRNFASSARWNSQRPSEVPPITAGRHQRNVVHVAEARMPCQDVCERRHPCRRRGKNQRVVVPAIGTAGFARDVSNTGFPENSDRQINAMMRISTPAATMFCKESSVETTPSLARIGLVAATFALAVYGDTLDGFAAQDLDERVDLSDSRDEKV